MVSAIQFVVAAAAAVATLCSAQADAISVGTYFRPVGKIVSAEPGNTAPYRRSPCPALNTLANHGYLPRNGQNISLAQLTDTIMAKFNMDTSVAALLVSQIPSFPFNLDILSTHNTLEHDASLVHTDAYFGRPPNEMNLTLVADFLQRADANGFIGLEAVGKTRKDRLAACMQDNPECSFTATQSRTAFAEGGAFIGLMGAKRSNDSVSVAHATSFLVAEKFPSDFAPAATVVTLAELQSIIVRIAGFAA